MEKRVIVQTRAIDEPADLNNQADFIWASEPMRIGQHEWRVVVFRSELYKCNCTQYEFRGPRAPFWADEKRWNAADRHWSTYNGNHCDGGIPKSLRKLYDANADTIRPLIR